MQTREINVLVLAYLGDTIYENYIRRYLIEKGIANVNDLQKEAVNYVSAKSQAGFLMKMIDDSFLSDDEILVVKRARNYKTTSHPKNCDIVTYKHATALEAIIGYLELSNKMVKYLTNFAKNGNPNAKYESMKARHKDLFKKPWAKWMMKRAWGRKVMFFFFGKKKDNPRTFPTHFPFVHKTDEERCENLVNIVLGYENPLIVTEKLDGTSSTYILEKKKKGYEFYVLSRNVRQMDEKQETYHDHNIYWDMAFKYDVENKLRKYLETDPELTYVCIQGESVGSVQGNPLKLTEDDLYVFNFIDSKYGRHPSNFAEIIVENMGMKFVPILDYCFKMPDDMETFKKMATAPSVVNPNVMREGIVLRDPTNDFSFKNVSREYLLKHGG